MSIIPEGFFAHHQYLENVELPHGLIELKRLAFLDCQGLTSVTIPNSVTTIGDGVFANCFNLKNVYIPPNVIHFGEYAFGGQNFDFTIHGVSGSAAEEFARQMNFTFMEWDPPPDPPAPLKPAPNLNTASEWARPEITSAYNKGFVPVDILDNYQSIITRQEFCRMAVKFVEYKTGEPIDALLNARGVTRNPDVFSDTSDPDILAAAALGITSGMGDGTFAPNGNITRQQAATFLMRVNGLLGMDTNDPPSAGYIDFHEVADWAENGVNFCYAAGIMQGSDGQFSPLNTYTRQESIATFDRIK